MPRFAKSKIKCLIFFVANLLKIRIKGYNGHNLNILKNNQIKFYIFRKPKNDRFLEAVATYDLYLKM